MGSSPQSVNFSPSGVNVPQPPTGLLFSGPRPNIQPTFSPPDSSYSATKSNFQPPFPGYPSKKPAVSQAPSPFPAQQGSFMPPPPASSSPFSSQQGSYAPPPPVAASLGYQSRGQMQHPSSAPPIGGIQSLTEDFSSLSLASLPGSIDPGCDHRTLPRPLDGDEEPSSFTKMYPMNCNPRYLRLTTSGIPSSQSLASRWHLTLGAVVCPLAEDPEGEEVPVINYISTGIIRCRRCRAYVNPYVTFTDARRKWRCNICALLNDEGNLYAVQHRLGSRMIYPDSLKFLCSYGLALSKSVPLKGGYADAQLDERCGAGFTMMALPVKRLLKLLYPSLIRIDEYLLKPSAQTDDFKNIMKRLPLVAESLDSRGLYLYDDGFRFVIWFGRMLSPDVAKNLLGADFAAELSKVILSEHDNEMSRRLMRILKKLRESDPSYYQLPYLVRQGEQPKEGLLLLVNLLEDQMGGTSGYVDWIMQIHRQVQQNT
ncbi:hypothetical protein ES332_D11G335700v1 [Gossypium tomentosum]|uniref:Zinc finger Sec23/Sec24-type domain-containing protein n=1 Tax=Gossypium tomentosum TaxID=34277 RepID=A0A5D2IVM8_GOSTO|nr:hypothetical protein ES332_D11G335700v1 [Gossypium tomentosum]